MRPRKKISIILFFVVLFIVLTGVCYLTYNQLNHSGLSFEVIYEYFHFQHVSREFADGNIDPLLESLAIPGQDNEYSVYGKETYGQDEDSYVSETKKYIREEYQNLFAGKALSLKKVTVDYSELDYYYLAEPRCLMVCLLYDVDGIEYGIRLTRNSGRRFYATDGFMLESETTYVSDGSSNSTDSEEGKTVENDSTEISELLNHRESLFCCMQPSDDGQFFLIKKAIRNYCQEYQKGERNTEILEIFSNSFIREELLNDCSEAVNEYFGQVHQRLQKIVNAGYYCSDIDFALQGYEKERHMYRYRVLLWFGYEQQERTYCLSFDCYRNQGLTQDYLIVSPETVELLGEQKESDIKNSMLGLWE